MDLGFQSLRLFKKRLARHYRTAQAKIELGKEWVLAQLADSAPKPVSQHADDPSKDAEDIFVQDLLVEDTVAPDYVQDATENLQEDAEHEEL